ncbi:MAG: NAD-dependent protein deacylase, partial [Candidatus Omnitrophica bacterium]|nr:NAD-dependent protein deacylase [Candidatus Omnitrophota bacterium]
AEFENHFERVLVYTQNIDGFHRQALSKNIIDIHGDMHNLYCLGCGWQKTLKDYSQIKIPPKCPVCRGDVRPDVVFFQETLPHDKVLRLEKELALGFDVYFSIGTSSVFHYIQQPIFLAKASNKFTVEINPDMSEVSSIVDIRISLCAVEALESIWKKFLSR